MASVSRKKVKVLVNQSAARSAVTPEPFESLEAALIDQFEKPLNRLEKSLRKRVTAAFMPFVWKNLTPGQRRSVAVQWDDKHDPAKETERQYWLDFHAAKMKLEAQIEKWSSTTATNASDLAKKESRLEELKKKLDAMNQKERRPARRVLAPHKNHLGEKKGPETISYVAYPKAFNMLSARVGATPDEVAAWIFLGPKEGGLSAVLNPNELDPPPEVVLLATSGDDRDYLSPLMSAWFDEREVDAFIPSDRFIVGSKLMERWSQIPGIQAEATILARLAEGRLVEIHPIWGCTKGTLPNMDAFPPMSEGLFFLSKVEIVEREDFGRVLDARITALTLSGDTNRSGHTNHNPDWQKRANTIATRQMEGTGRGVTKNKVAKILAMELGQTEETVLRRIRKEW